MNFFCFLVFQVLLIHRGLFSTSVIINCQYQHDIWYIINRIYECNVQSDVDITSIDNSIIESAAGTHISGLTNANVAGFFAHGKNIKFFPRRLEKVFKNLRAIHIQYGVLKEIHQTDLKPFRALENLYLGNNDIEIIEEGLFNFNLNLGYISFSFNKITQIHPTVFDNLTKLKHLYLQSNVCIDAFGFEQIKIKQLINEVKSNCTNVLFTTTQKSTNDFDYQNINNVKDDLRSIKSKISDVFNKVMESAVNINIINEKFSICEDLTTRLTKLNQRMNFFDRKIESFEKSYVNFKFETFGILNKILDKLDENSEKLEQVYDIFLGMQRANDETCDAI